MRAAAEARAAGPVRRLPRRERHRDRAGHSEPRRAGSRLSRRRAAPVPQRRAQRARRCARHRARCPMPTSTRWPTGMRRSLRRRSQRDEDHRQAHRRVRRLDPVSQSVRASDRRDASAISTTSRSTQLRPPSMGSGFIEPLFAFAGALSKSDGRVSEVEIAAAESLMARLRLDGAQRRAAIERFNAGKQPDFAVAACDRRSQALVRRTARSRISRARSAARSRLRRRRAGRGEARAGAQALLGARRQRSRARGAVGDERLRARRGPDRAAPGARPPPRCRCAPIRMPCSASSAAPASATSSAPTAS